MRQLDSFVDETAPVRGVLSAQEAKAQLWNHLNDTGWVMRNTNLESPVHEFPFATTLTRPPSDKDVFPWVRIWFVENTILVGSSELMKDAREPEFNFQNLTPVEIVELACCQHGV